MKTADHGDRTDTTAGEFVTEEIHRLRADAAVWREMDGETVLLDLRTSTYLGVNETGSTLWPILADGATVAQLVDALVERFQVPLDRAREDVEAFVAECSRRGLLT